MPSPRECPLCGGGNIRRVNGPTGKPTERGKALIRVRECADCGHRGYTVEFWVHGEDGALAADILTEPAA